MAEDKGHNLPVSSRPRTVPTSHARKLGQAMVSCRMRSGRPTGKLQVGLEPGQLLALAKGRKSRLPADT